MKRGLNDLAAGPCEQGHEEDGCPNHSVAEKRIEKADFESVAEKGRMG